MLDEIYPDSPAEFLVTIVTMLLNLTLSDTSISRLQTHDSEGSEEWLLLSWGWGDSDSVLSRVRLSELMQELHAL